MRRPKAQPRVPHFVVLYVRVSTTEQAESGHSLAAQESELRDYCATRGLTVARVFVERGESGTGDRRPEFQRMLEDVLSPASEIGRVLVTHFSRFMRDAGKAATRREQLRRAGIELVATQQPVGTDANGSFVTGMFDLISQFESEMIGIRTRAGMLQAAKDGFVPAAKAPFGYTIVARTEDGANREERKQRKLVINEEEARTVRMIVRLYIGGLGGLAIAEELNRRGITHRGSRWTRDSVLAVLADTTIAGRYYWGKRDSRNQRLRPESEWVLIPVEPILDEDTFARVAALREERDPVKHPGRSSSSPLLLSGLAKCASCGASLELLTGSKRLRDGSRRTYRHYRCRNVRRAKTTCESVPLAVHHLEHSVMSSIAAAALCKKRARTILQTLLDGPLTKERETTIARLRRQIDALQMRRERLIDAVEQGSMTPSMVATRLTELEASLAAVERELAQVRAMHVPTAPSDELVERFRERAHAAITGDRTFATTYLRNLHPRVEVDNRGAILVVGGIARRIVHAKQRAERGPNPQGTGVAASVSNDGAPPSRPNHNSPPPSKR